jgi:cellulose synthase/poly-beta-1,6-N-acetylglucosamine synthase-like glycosyltransferase
MCFSAAASSENDQGSMNFASKTAPTTLKARNENNAPPPSQLQGEDNIKVSIVMPCLNEADTLETCIRKAQRALSENNIAGEVVVADNGSTDGSQAIAERCTRPVPQPPLGRHV